MANAPETPATPAMPDEPTIPAMPARLDEPTTPANARPDNVFFTARVSLNMETKLLGLGLLAGRLQ
jgi:hypothetical protein